MQPYQIITIKSMTKQEKVATVAKLMTTSIRNDGTEFRHFAFNDERDAELRALFLEHYSVQDIDYQIWSNACDIVAEACEDAQDTTSDKVEDHIYELAADSASMYTSDRLAYLSPMNEDEISETMREYGMHSIADACAAWYDRQCEQAAIIILGWVNA